MHKGRGDNIGSTTRRPKDLQAGEVSEDWIKALNEKVKHALEQVIANVH